MVTTSFDGFYGFRSHNIDYIADCYCNARHMQTQETKKKDKH